MKGLKDNVYPKIIMAKESSLQRLKLYSFKLDALLEITQAINANLSINGLLDRYRGILAG